MARKSLNLSSTPSRNAQRGNSKNSSTSVVRYHPSHLVIDAVDFKPIRREPVSVVVSPTVSRDFVAVPNLASPVVMSRPVGPTVSPLKAARVTSPPVARRSVYQRVVDKMCKARPTNKTRKGRGKGKRFAPWC